MSRIYASQSYWYTVSVTHSPLSITQSYRKSTPSQCQDAQWQDPQHCQARHLHTRHQTKQVLHLQTVHWFHYNTRSNPNSHSPEPDTFLTLSYKRQPSLAISSIQPRPGQSPSLQWINQHQPGHITLRLYSSHEFSSETRIGHQPGHITLRFYSSH